jgi:hypothetical protein
MAVSKFTSASGGNDFNINIGSTYSVVNFTQEYAAGSYSFTSAQLDITMDVYAYNAQGTLVGYTNGKGLTTSSGFIKMVIIGGTVGDVLSFTYKTTFYSNAETAELTAGPVILSVTPTALPNVNSSTTVTGLNFATDITATFTGTDNLVRNAKSLVRGSANSLVVTRPDSFPIAYAPYILTVTNPSVAYQPTGSAANTISVTAGVVPVWVSNSTLTSLGGFPLTALSATDADGGSSITYSLVSGSLPTGTSLNTSTGAFTGNPTTAGTYNFGIRATDSGGNYADRSFTYTINSTAADATYYYQVFTTNTTLTLPQSITADVLVIAGGGGSGSVNNVPGGGGAGGVSYQSGRSLSTSNISITVGSGGAPSTNGGNSTFDTITSNGGGYGGSESPGGPGNAGGSGGGGTYNGGGPGSANQGSTGGATGYGNAGGSGGNAGGAYPAGGGGGAGAAGQAGQNGVSGGKGGDGLNTWSTWLSVITPVMTGVSGWASATSTGYIAGGGGGGSWTGSSTSSLGGAGGGGHGGANISGQDIATNGVPNTGGGGGGGGGSGSIASSAGAFKTGGSGLVVIRYTRSQVGG